MISRNWSRNSIAFAVAIAVLSVYSMVALAKPGAQKNTGELSVSGQVTVNGQATYRKNDYYWRQLGIGNSSGPAYQAVTNTALLSQGSYEVSSNTTGNVFVPQNTESFTYDGDGNLSTDGRWTYTWDGENRLSTIVARTAVGPQQSMKFEYDSQGRRVGKKVWNNTTFNGTPATEQKFLYDGWNLVAILNSTFGLQTAFVWGLDLSGSVQGAGGVGGLLELNDSVNGTHFACFDGNGNIAALAKAADGASSAKYEYGPFGVAEHSVECTTLVVYDDEVVRLGILNQCVIAKQRNARLKCANKSLFKA